MNTLSRIGLAGLLLGLAAGSASAQTNGFELQCMSARAAGRGCVTRAQPDLPTSLFRDPAGIAAYKSPQLEVNVAPFMPSLTFENAANQQTKGALHAYPLASVAYVGRTVGTRLHWAVGLEPIGGFGSDFRLHNALLSGQGSTVAYQSFFAAVKFGPTVAYDLLPGLSVGASLSGVYAQIRQFRMPFTMAPSFARGMAAIPQLDPTVYGPLFQQFTQMTAYGNSAGFGGMTWAADAGVAYRAPSGWAISASWSPKRTIKLDGGTATIDMNAQFQQMLGAMVAARQAAYGETAQEAQGAVLQQLSAAGLDLSAGMKAEYQASTDLTLPMTVGAGVHAPLRPWWTLAAEVEWRQWSRAETTMPFRLSGGSNANLNLLIAGDPTDGSFAYPFPLEWKDSWSWKVGTEFTVHDAYKLRAGFLTGTDPVPANTVFITFPAIATRAITIGAGARLFGMPLDVAYVHALSQGIDGCASKHLMGAEYDGSHTTMSQNVVTVGTTIHF